MFFFWFRSCFVAFPQALKTRWGTGTTSTSSWLVYSRSEMDYWCHLWHIHLHFQQFHIHDMLEFYIGITPCINRFWSKYFQLHLKWEKSTNAERANENDIKIWIAASLYSPCMAKCCSYTNTGTEEMALKFFHYILIDVNEFPNYIFT